MKQQINRVDVKYLKRALIEIFQKYSKGKDVSFVEKLDDEGIVLLYEIIKIKDKTKREQKFQEIANEKENLVKEMKNIVKDIFEIKTTIIEEKEEIIQTLQDLGKMKNVIKESQENKQEEKELDQLEKDLEILGE